MASGCERLLAKSGADNHYDALLALPTLEGLRLEAARSIVSSGVSAGADMLRMPANVLRLREAGVATYDILEPSWCAPVNRAARGGERPSTQHAAQISHSEQFLL